MSPRHFHKHFIVLLASILVLGGTIKILIWSHMGHDSRDMQQLKIRTNQWVRASRRCRVLIN